MTLFEPDTKPAAKGKKPAKVRQSVSGPQAEPPPQKQNLPAVRDEPRSMLSVIASAAANPHVDVQKMKELLAMQREIQQDEQRRAFNDSLREARQEMPSIARDGINKDTKKRYATLEKVSTEIDKIAHKHGLMMTFSTDDSPLVDHYRITCDVRHTSGHVERYKVDLKADTAGAKGTANKTPVQGVGSTISYGRRYLKMMIFDLLIAGEDNDGNARARSEEASDSDVLITPEQEKILIGAINFCGVGMERFCSKYGVKTVADLPARLYEEAKSACKNFKGKKEAPGG